MKTETKCGICDGTGAVAAVRGFDSCPNGCLDERAAAPRLTLVPLAAEQPTETVSAIAAFIVGAYEQVRPRLVDPEEVTVVARLGGAR
jgi:hypothetical protein